MWGRMKGMVKIPRMFVAMVRSNASDTLPPSCYRSRQQQGSAGGISWVRQAAPLLAVTLVATGFQARHCAGSLGQCRESFVALPPPCH